MKTLVIDNYDSFTWNLVHLLAMISGSHPTVIRNDEAPWSAVSSWGFDSIVISPGPGHPARERDFGVSRDAVLHSTVPVLGICLGLQGIAANLGGVVCHAPAPMHGRTSWVIHDGTDLFRSIPSPFRVARYHSLMAQEPLPAGLRKQAWTDDGMVMALAHETRPLWGVQFHPESILTEHGRRLMENFHELTQRFHGIRVDSTCSCAGQRPARPVAGHTKPGGHQEYRAFWKEIPLVDSETAFVSLYAHSEVAFWLDSAARGMETARWSYLGDTRGPCSRLLDYSRDPRALRIVHGDREEWCAQSILEHFRHNTVRVDSPPPGPFVGGHIGWLGYEMRHECGALSAQRSSMSDALFIKADRFIAIDHVQARTYVVAIDHSDQEARARRWIEETAKRLADLPATPAVLPLGLGVASRPRFTLNRDRASYLSDIGQCLEWIHDGETYQVCLTNEITCDLTVDPLSLYRSVRRLNAAPFAAFLRWPGGSVLSASPERFLRVGSDGCVEARPIKGTSARSNDAAVDRQLARLLEGSEKNRAENAMIVDLIRNDLSRVCLPGSVCVEKLCAVETHATVHQLVSTVTAQLCPNRSVIDLIYATFPGGSMTGAPKTRTLELIDRLEQRPRGIYSGVLGYLGADGAADLSIVIRTIVVAGDKLRIGAGGGIVAQSTPEDEFAEMMLKARASMQAVTLACTGSSEVREEDVVL